MSVQAEVTLISATNKRIREKTSTCEYERLNCMWTWTMSAWFNYTYLMSIFSKWLWKDVWLHRRWGSYCIMGVEGRFCVSVLDINLSVDLLLISTTPVIPFKSTDSTVDSVLGTTSPCILFVNDFYYLLHLSITIHSAPKMTRVRCSNTKYKMYNVVVLLSCHLTSQDWLSINVTEFLTKALLSVFFVRWIVDWERWWSPMISNHSTINVVQTTTVAFKYDQNRNDWNRWFQKGNCDVLVYESKLSKRAIDNVMNTILTVSFVSYDAIFCYQHTTASSRTNY